MIALNSASKLFQAVWSVVKQISQSKGAGCSFGTFDQTCAILCGLANFFFSRDNYNLFDQPEFWEIIQKGLVINQPLTRKRTMYLLKRALDLLDKLPWDLSVMSERGYNIFYWSSDHKETLRGIWQDYVLLMETFDEKQVNNQCNIFFFFQISVFIPCGGLLGKLRTEHHW